MADFDPEYTLHKLTFEGQEDALRKLLEESPEAKNKLEQRDRSGFTPLMIAAAVGNYGILNLLLQHGASYKVVSAMENSLLMYAAKSGSIECVKAIAQLDPDAINAMNRNGDTAVMFASAAGHSEVIRTLTALGARVDTANNESLTPFHCASNAESLEALAAVFASSPQILVDIVNVPNVAGRTALFFAAESGDAARVRVLLRLGTVVTKKDKKNKTALQVCVDKKGETFKLLQQAWAAEEEQSRRAEADLLGSSSTGSTAAKKTTAAASKQRESGKAKISAKKSTAKAVETLESSSSESESESEISRPSTELPRSAVLIEAKTLPKSTEVEEDSTSGVWQTVGAKKPSAPPPTASTAPQTKQTKKQEVKKPQKQKQTAKATAPVAQQPKKKPEAPSMPAQNQNHKDTKKVSQEALKRNEESKFDDLSELEDAVCRLHSQAADLDLKPHNVCGLHLEELSMAQLSALEEIHRRQLVTLEDLKVEMAKKQERIRLIEENKIYQQIQTLSKKV